MSGSSECNVTDNRFIGNTISGANLIDSHGNYVYHNTFINNGMQNAVDNGENQWDSGPITGGTTGAIIKRLKSGKHPPADPDQRSNRYPFQILGMGNRWMTWISGFSKQFRWN